MDNKKKLAYATIGALIGGVTLTAGVKVLDITIRLGYFGIGYAAGYITFLYLSGMS